MFGHEESKKTLMELFDDASSIFEINYMHKWYDTEYYKSKTLYYSQMKNVFWDG